jgi:hypothetical protein
VPLKSQSSVAPDTSALIAFNARFRNAGEEKDAKEREARTARKAAGKAALKKLLSEKAGTVESRKRKNREEEAATEKAMLDSLQGETWTRVTTLIDIHSKDAPVKGKDGKPEKRMAGEDIGQARMRDVLIGLKAKPLAV